VVLGKFRKFEPWKQYECRFGKMFRPYH